MRSQAAAAARARCRSCGGGLSFAAWSRGEDLCPICEQMDAEPAAVYRPAVPVPVPPAAAPARPLPDVLLDDLVAALEAEAARPPQGPVQVALHDVLDEVGFGRDSHELSWSVWGFAAGFAANLAIAKYAQMASGDSMGAFLPAFVFGGLAAGATCAALGWALAKLRAAK